MKVDSIIVTSEYETEKRGGLGTYTNMIVKYFKKRFTRVCVIEIPMGNKKEFAFERKGEDEIFFKAPFPNLQKIRSKEYDKVINKFVNEVELKNKCIILGNDWFGGYVAEKIKKALDLEVKSVFIPHIFSSLIALKGYEGDRFEYLVGKLSSNTKTNNLHSIEKKLIDSVDEILFASEYMKGFAKERMEGEGRGTVIAHYVEDVPRTKSSYKDEVDDIIFAGRFVPQKGILDLAEHIRGILKVLPESRFHFYGRGQMEPILKWATRRFGDRVQIHGFVPREKLLSLLPEMDLLVMPSIFEPFGYSALEAMAAGVPIVATDTGGLGEMTSWLPDELQFQRSFGKNPLYHSPGNVGAYIPREELLRVFRFVAENPDVLRRVGQKGRRIAREQYTRQRFEHDMDNFLETIDARSIGAT